MELSNRNSKTGAKITLIILLLSIIGKFITFYQTEYQLVNPLIPEATILQIVKPFIFTGLITTVVAVIALLLFFYGKYLLVITISMLTLFWQMIYPYLAT